MSIFPQAGWRVYDPSTVVLEPMILAGFPTTVAFAGTSFVTVLPAPMTAFSPTVIPPSRVEPEPIEAPRFTKVRWQSQSASV